MTKKKKVTTQTGFTTKIKVGRKPLKVGLKKVPVCFAVDPKVYARAKKLSEKQKITFSSYISTMLEATVGKSK